MTWTCGETCIRSSGLICGAGGIRAPGGMGAAGGVWAPTICGVRRVRARATYKRMTKFLCCRGESRSKSTKPQDRISFLREVDGLRERPILQRIVKRHQLGACLGKHTTEAGQECVVRKLVGPEAEHTPITQFRCQLLQTLGLIEARMTRIEQRTGRMIDIDKDR